MEQCALFVRADRYSSTLGDAKGKTVLSSDSKLIPDQIGLDLNCCDHVRQKSASAPSATSLCAIPDSDGMHAQFLRERLQQTREYRVLFSVGYIRRDAATHENMLVGRRCKQNLTLVGQGQVGHSGVLCAG